MKKSIISLLKSKSYICITLISAIASYLFTITHNAIDIDDTAIALYFQDGLAAYVHRWTIFFFCHIFRIPADYKCVGVIEAISVLILCCSVCIWTALWKWLFDRIIPIHPFFYGLISALFISNPIICEVFIYFLHNGICIAYGMTGLALYMFLRSTEGTIKKRIGYLALSTLLLALSVGCYESFLLAFVLGAFITFIVIRALMQDCESESDSVPLPSSKIIPWIINGSLIIIGTIAIRAVMYRICLRFYDPSMFSDYDVAYRSYFGDNLTAISELGMTLKRYISLYHINGMMYLPVTLLIIARITILAFGIISAIKKKDIFILLSAMIIAVLPPFMAVFEGTVTKYRSAQYVPMVSAYALLLLMVLIGKKLGNKSNSKPFISLAAVISLIMIAQIVNTNKWFHANYEKYRYAESEIIKIAEDLRSGNYDISKPIAFVGANRVPTDIVSNGSIPFDSKRFGMICRLTDPIDPHWKEKFYSSAPGLGYIYNASPQESILQWGADAFNHSDEQLIKLMDMLGYEGFTAADSETMIRARELQDEINIPSISSGENYIYEAEDFLLVNIDAN